MVTAPAIPPRLRVDKTQLLIVDFQEKLAPHVHDTARVAAQTVRMLRAAAVLGVPALLCQQYTAGLGQTLADIADAAGTARRFEKTTFSACGDDALSRELLSAQRPSVLIAGIETHVCVQQTVLDLLREGGQPVVLADAVGSRRDLDHRVALDGMRAAGARITTVESAIFELLQRCDAATFKDILRIVK